MSLEPESASPPTSPPPPPASPPSTSPPPPHQPPGGPAPRGYFAQLFLADTFWTMLWRLFSLVLIVFALGFLGYMFFGSGAPKLELKDGEFMRGLITILLLVVTLLLVVLIILGALFSQDQDANIKRVTQSREVLTPLFGILGTIIGFYFGAATQQKATEDMKDAAAAATQAAAVAPMPTPIPVPRSAP